MELKGLYQCEYIVRGDTPTLFFFIRNEDGTKDVKCVSDFKPYFYVDSDAVISEEYLTAGYSIKEGFTNLYGKPVKKITYTNPYDTYKLRDLFSVHYEADILFTLRYLIDNDISITPVKYRTLIMDIETTMESGFPRADNPIQKIICATFYDNFLDKYISMIWRDDFEQCCIEEGNKILYKFNNEKKMLETVLNLIEKLDPDILVAWNITFDLGYLVARMRSLKVDFYRLSNLKSVKVREHDIIIKGRVLFDLLGAYKKMSPGGLVSFSLDAVSERENLELHKLKILSTDKEWKERWENLLSYNIRDVELVKLIDEKCGVISFFDEIRCAAGLTNLNDCFYYSRVIDTFILRRYKGSIVFPSKGEFTEESEGIRGAFVYEPVKGLHKNVCVMDMKGLYPSIIQTFNLSTETIVNGSDVPYVTINGIKFRQDNRGILPSIIEDLIKLRDMCKVEAEKYEPGSIEYKTWMQRRMARKFLVNAVYGVNALTSFRLYDKRVAEAITYIGRELMMWNASIVESEGHVIVSGDTDSLFIKIKLGNIPLNEGNRLTKLLNSSLTAFVKKFGASNHYMKLEFEKIYASMLVGAKKRYIGKIIWKENKEVNYNEYVGFEVRRSDSTKLARDIQRNVCDMILDTIEKDIILKYIRECTQKLKQQSVDMIAIPTKLEKDSYYIEKESDGIIERKPLNLPRVKAAEFSNRVLGTNFRAGSKFMMIYVNHPETNSIAFDDTKQIEELKKVIDWRKTAQVNIFMKLKTIFEVLGWEADLFRLEEAYYRMLDGQTTLI